jgi:hypothetical protein
MENRKRSMLEIIIDVKENLLSCYEVDYLKERYENSDFHELAESFLSVYYHQTIEDAFNLVGDVWSRVWLEVDEFSIGKDDATAFDIVQGNLYGVYYDAVSEAIEDIIESEVKENV